MYMYYVERALPRVTYVCVHAEGTCRELTRTSPRPASVTKFVIVSDDPERERDCVRERYSRVCACVRVCGSRQVCRPVCGQAGAQDAIVRVLVRVPQPRRMTLRVVGSIRDTHVFMARGT